MSPCARRGDGEALVRLKWTVVRQWSPRSLDAMQTFLAALAVLAYDQRVATRWGEIQAYARLRGRPRPANDS
jgi:predicted nucleic acid-binding protein